MLTQDVKGSNNPAEDTGVLYLCNLDSAEDFVDHMFRRLVLNRRSRHDTHDIERVPMPVDRLQTLRERIAEERTAVRRRIRCLVPQLLLHEESLEQVI